VDLGYGWNTQTLSQGKTYHRGDFTGGAAVVASMQLGRFRLAFDGMFGGVALKVDDKSTVKPAVVGTAALLYGF